MQKEKYGFVYIWYDSYRKMYYIGSHWGTENDGYICSSNRMRDAYRRRPTDFKRRILKSNISDRKETLLEEHKWLSLIEKNDLGKKYYNLRQHIWGHWTTDVNYLMTVGEKISKANKGDPRRSEWMKNRVLSEETKEKIRQANLGKTYSAETNAKKGGNRDYSDNIFIEKMSLAAKNRSEETRNKISENTKRLQAEGKIGMKGRKHSKETIEKMKNSASLRNLNNNKISIKE